MLGKDYSFVRGFADILFTAKDIEGDQPGDGALRMLANASVMKLVFSNLYEYLVRNNEMKGIEQQDIEYKKELWEISNKFYPEKAEQERIKVCKAIMGFLWLLNN